MLLHSWIIFLTSGTLYSILRMSSLFLHSRNRPLKSYYSKTTKRKCVTLSNLKLLLLCFFLFQLLNKIDTLKSRIENLKEVNTHEFLCVYSIKAMELVEKTKLLRKLIKSSIAYSYKDRNTGSISADIFLPKSKPILLGILYRLLDKSDFVKHNNVFTETGVLGEWPSGLRR